MNTLALHRDDCISLLGITHPTETRAIASAPAGVMGLDTCEQPHTREAVEEGAKRQVWTQAGDRDCLYLNGPIFLLKYPSSSHRSESKHSCGFRRDGLVRISVTSHPNEVAHGFAA